MPSTCFVTGASGFIGQAVTRRLGRAGMTIRALGRDPARLPAGTIQVLGDLEEVTDWAALLRGCDTVIHLAARVHVMRERESDPLARFRAVNRDATRRLAEGALAAGARRFVYISTIKVNGEATAGVPFRPDDPPAPSDPYGVSKWEAEQELRMIEARGLEVTVIRPPLVHGPGVGGNLRRLLGLLARGLPLPLGAVRNSRRLVGRENLADLIATAVTHPGAAGQTFLAGDAESVGTPELLRLISAGLGRSARLVPVPVALLRAGGVLTGRADEIERLVGSLEVDISATESRLGWRPPVSLADGLAEMARAWTPTR